MTSSGSGTSRYLFLLRASLAIGAVYDVILSALLLFAAPLLAGMLGLPLPGQPFYLWLIGVLLLIVAGVYALAAYDPMAYAGNVLLAIGGRGLAGGMLVLAASGGPELRALYLMGGVDLAFALVHAVLWWPLRHLRSQLL